MAGRSLQKLKSVDFFKKLPADLTEATLAGAWISISAAIVMVLLLVMEMSSFMRLQTTTELVVDRSKQHELLRINFNISFPALSCEFATLDVSDSLGTKRMNLTKTVRKTPVSLDLQQLAAATEDVKKAGPKYDEDGTVTVNEADISQPLTRANFEATLAKYPIVVVNFFAPWCHWCQRLAPTWEAATAQVHQKYPEWDGRIRFAKVDCTREMDLCREHFIQGFPSIRVFRKGHDDIVVMGHRDHEAYIGDRTLESFLSFADALTPSAGLPHHRHDSLTKAPKSNGCNLAGFVMVKKVPGTLHFTARGDGHSFEHTWMNMTHVVHAFNYGTRPTARKLYHLQKLHPLGLSEDWADKLQGQQFISEHTQDTHEHYMQVVLTTVEPKRGGKGGVYDAYEYTAHSHTYVAESIPVAKFSYTMSPIQIVVRESRRAWYHFLTTTCAIIGGVFTVAGILDGIWYQSMKLAKKVELGKQG